MTSSRVKGLAAMLVTGLVLVATSTPTPVMVTSFPVIFDGGCQVGPGVVAFDDQCSGRVVVGDDGGSTWQLQSRQSCSLSFQTETFSFSSRHPRQLDGGIPTADGGTRLVRMTDDLEVVCTATPDDAGHALECEWSICAPGSSVACVRHPKCVGQLTRTP
jgi:hypothetical protein